MSLLWVLFFLHYDYLLTASIMIEMQQGLQCIEVLGAENLTQVGTGYLRTVKKSMLLHIHQKLTIMGTWAIF